MGERWHVVQINLTVPTWHFNFDPLSLSGLPSPHSTCRVGTIPARPMVLLGFTASCSEVFRALQGSVLGRSERFPDSRLASVWTLQATPHMQWGGGRNVWYSDDTFWRLRPLPWAVDQLLTLLKCVRQVLDHSKLAQTPQELAAQPHESPWKWKELFKRT